MDLLVFDIGNSDVVIALNSNSEWKNLSRIPSDDCLDINSFISRLAEIRDKNGLQGKIETIVISSVVPKLTQLLPDEIELVLGVKPFVITADNYSAINMEIDNPDEIGSDLVANALAAYSRFGKALVVVDFGTALTFTIVSENGTLLGVAIAPGIRTAMKSLVGNTALLPEILLELPGSVIGKNTVHAMQAGIMHGSAGMVEGILNTIRKEIGECKVIATGGMAGVMKPLHALFDSIEPNLTLEGIELIYNSGKKE